MKTTLIELTSMMKYIHRKIFKILLSNDDEEKTSFDGKSVNGKVAPRQRVLNKLKEQFLIEMANETTTESLLYHTSFIVYIREEEYERLSPSFAHTVRDAANVFEREILKKKKVKDNADYRPHSRYWEMQLVAIPKETEIDGISTDPIDENIVIIKSKLFADNEYDSRIQDDIHYVTTIHTKDSSRRVSNALNLEVLKGLTESAKDKYRVEINLGRLSSEVPNSETERMNNKKDIVATLHIVDGFFILGERKFRGYNMTGDRLLVSGKNGSASNVTDEIHIDDETVLNPTIEIQRDKKTGLFTLKAWGDVKLGGKRVVSDNEVPLPPDSYIMINGDYQIEFKTK